MKKRGMGGPPRPSARAAALQAVASDIGGPRRQAALSAYLRPPAPAAAVAIVEAERAQIVASQKERRASKRGRDGAEVEGSVSGQGGSTTAPSSESAVGASTNFSLNLQSSQGSTTPSRAVKRTISGGSPPPGASRAAGFATPDGILVRVRERLAAAREGGGAVTSICPTAHTPFMSALLGGGVGTGLDTISRLESLGLVHPPEGTLGSTPPLLDPESPGTNDAILQTALAANSSLSLALINSCAALPAGAMNSSQNPSKTANLYSSAEVWRRLADMVWADCALIKEISLASTSGRAMYVSPMRKARQEMMNLLRLRQRSLMAGMYKTVSSQSLCGEASSKHVDIRGESELIPKRAREVLVRLSAVFDALEAPSSIPPAIVELLDDDKNDETYVGAVDTGDVEKEEERPPSQVKRLAQLWEEEIGDAEKTSVVFPVEESFTNTENPLSPLDLLPGAGTRTSEQRVCAPSLDFSQQVELGTCPVVSPAASFPIPAQNILTSEWFSNPGLDPLSFVTNQVPAALALLASFSENGRVSVAKGRRWAVELVRARIGDCLHKRGLGVEPPPNDNNSISLSPAPASNINRLPMKAGQARRELEKARCEGKGGGGSSAPSNLTTPLRIADLHVARKLTLQITAILQYMALCIECKGGVEDSGGEQEGDFSSYLRRASAHLSRLLYVANYALDAANLQLSAALEAFPGLAGTLPRTSSLAAHAATAQHAVCLLPCLSRKPRPTGVVNYWVHQCIEQPFWSTIPKTVLWVYSVLGLEVEGELRSAAKNAGITEEGWWDVGGAWGGSSADPDASLSISAPIYQARAHTIGKSGVGVKEVSEGNAGCDKLGVKGKNTIKPADPVADGSTVEKLSDKGKPVDPLVLNRKIGGRVVVRATLDNLVGVKTLVQRQRKL